MKRKLLPTRIPVPEFHSDPEAADYFESHSVADLWDQLAEGEPVKLSKVLAKSVRERQTRPKSPVSLRLEQGQITAAKKIAATRSIGYQTQLRMWIAEGILRDARRTGRANAP
jgi:predicted DNA binding CopG/RHH family protein